MTRPPQYHDCDGSPPALPQCRRAWLAPTRHRVRGAVHGSLPVRGCVQGAVPSSAADGISSTTPSTSDLCGIERESILAATGKSIDTVSAARCTTCDAATSIPTAVSNCPASISFSTPRGSRRQTQSVHSRRLRTGNPRCRRAPLTKGADGIGTCLRRSKGRDAVLLQYPAGFVGTRPHEYGEGFHRCPGRKDAIVHRLR